MRLIWRASFSTATTPTPYWPEGSEYDDDQPPLCQSFDGKVGYGEPRRAPARTAFSTSSAAMGNNKGKACKNMRECSISKLRSGEYMPIQIALPPTSLTPYTASSMKRSSPCRRKVCTGVVRIGLEEGRQRQPRILRRHLYQDRRFRRGKHWRISALTRMASWRRSRTSTRRERRRRRSLQHHRRRRCLASGIASTMVRTLR